MRAGALFSLLIISLSIVTSSCGKSTPESTDSIEPTFASIKANIFVPKCVSCHSELNEYSGTKDYLTAGNAAASVLFTEVESGSMPKNAEKLSDAEINAIKDWINDGAKESTGAIVAPSVASPAPSVAPTPSTSPTAVTLVRFNEVRSAIIETKCLRCHEDMASHEGVMAYITPYNSARSSFYTEVESGRMPRRGAKLPAEEIALIRAWIDSGATN